MMPPYKCPKSLYTDCLEQVKKLIEKCCVNIEDKYGNFDRLECQQQTHLFQAYLLSKIPGIVLDDVCEVVTSMHLVNPRQHDLRIALSVYMHKGMRKFSSPFQYSLPTLTKKTFWQDHIANLHNIIKLDINRICSDEILEVVGNNCSKLEEIHILSRLECDSDSFNALKLKFSISDQGLLYLSKCKQLKKIMMNRYLRSVHGGRMMTNAGIRKLVKSLPNIQFINYENMGSILAEDMEDINYIPLIYISDIPSSSKDINAINKLCTNLRHLCLKYRHNSSESPNKILKTLALSDIKIATLELVNFPFCEEMIELLEIKGENLNSFLHTGTGSSQSTLEVKVIGHFCPSIKHLHLKDIKVDDKPQSLVFDTSKKIFTKLECLTLWENDWPLDDILPICLSNATNLENFTILTKYSIGHIIEKIIKLNSFSELKSLVILTKEPLCINTIRYFFKNCANLTQLSFNHCVTSEFHLEIEKNNLDLKIIYY